MWRRLLAILLVLAAPASAERGRVLLRFAPPPAATNLLWIGAHPDDELLVAPLLDVYCRERSGRCTIAVATRGEAGWCGLPSCAPDLATVREQELRAAAAYFGAAVVVGAFADGSSPDPAAVLGRWNGETLALDGFLDSLFEVIRPDLVLTLDPRHGSTCHPDHRAIGQAVLAAAARHGVRAGVLLMRALPVGDWDAVAVAPNLGAADFVLDAARRSPLQGEARWNALLEIGRIHASQFSPRALAALDAVAADRRLLGIDLDPPVPFADACSAQSLVRSQPR